MYKKKSVFVYLHETNVDEFFMKTTEIIFEKHFHDFPLQDMNKSLYENSCFFDHSYNMPFRKLTIETLN